MKHLAKRIFKGLEKDCRGVPDSIDTQIPEYKEIEDPQESKATMRAYLEGLMDQAEAYAGDHTSAVLEECREILSDEKFTSRCKFSVGQNFGLHKSNRFGTACQFVLDGII